MGLANLAASVGVTLLTYCAEIGGVALALELVSSINRYLWMPVAGIAVWLVLWRVKFSVLENAFGLAGLTLIAFSVAVWRLGPDWSVLLSQATTLEPPGQETWATYAYYAVALFGAGLTPYEVFFFSSGGVEERWTSQSLRTMRLNVFVGFPLGGLLSLSVAAAAAIVLEPAKIEVESLGQVALPVVVALGKIGLAAALLGFFAATFGAACETGLSVGYSICQYFGWQWGKFVPPLRAARFHTILLLSTVVAVGTLLTTADPIMLTEYSVVFSALALPLTYLPILVVANDHSYMGTHVNRRVANTLGGAFLVLIGVAAAAAIPLMVLARAGQ